MKYNFKRPNKNCKKFWLNIFGLIFYSDQIFKKQEFMTQWKKSWANSPIYETMAYLFLSELLFLANTMNIHLYFDNLFKPYFKMLEIKPDPFWTG